MVNLLTVSVAALGLSFALSGRDAVRNLLAEFYARENYALGRAIQVEGYQGILEAIDTLKATISTEKSQVTMPNCLLIEQVVVSDKNEI